jgi:hypothetical protein
MSRIYDLFCQLLDLLVDAIFLSLWALTNWLLLFGFRHFHPSGIIVAVVWLAQGIFAAFTLAIIALHLVRDLKGSVADTGLKALWKKLKDMANQLFSLTVFSTLFVGWTFFNWGLHFVLSLFPAEGLSLINISHGIAQVFVAIATLWRVVKPMYKELTRIYKRLFPA